MSADHDVLIVGAGLIPCGDHCRDGSINGAMRSGAAAAATVLREFRSVAQ